MSGNPNIVGNTASTSGWMSLHDSRDIIPTLYPSPSSENICNHPEDDMDTPDTSNFSPLDENTIAKLRTSSHSSSQGPSTTQIGLDSLILPNANAKRDSQCPSVKECTVVEFEQEHGTDSKESNFCERDDSNIPPELRISEREAILSPSLEPGDAKEPLQVVSWACNASYTAITIQFNRPMVPVNAHGELLHVDTPVIIQPHLEGVWEWCDPFHAVYKALPLGSTFPGSCKYTVRVPKGTRGTEGNTLKHTFEYQFTTPVPELVLCSPSDRTVNTLLPTITMCFNQKVNPDQLIKQIRLRKQRWLLPSGFYDLRLVKSQNLQEHEDLGNGALNEITQWYSKEATVITVRPKAELPKATTFEWFIEGPIRSLEGPLCNPNEAPSTVLFDTYSPLSLQPRYLNKGYCKAKPFSDLGIFLFNNILDTKHFKPEHITIAPELPGCKIEVKGRAVVIRGETQPGTEYLVFFGQNMKDMLGQFLAFEQTVVVHVTPAPQLLHILGYGKPAYNFLSDPMSASTSVVTLDPFRQELELPIVSCNFRRIKVRVYSTRPENFYHYFNYLKDMMKWSKIERNNFVLFNMKKRAGSRPVPFEATLWEEFTLSVSDYMNDQKIISYINLRPYMKNTNGFGHFIVSVDVIDGDIFNKALLKDNRRPFGFDLWCQVTNLNLDACFMSEGADQRGVVVSTSYLIDGSIAPNADVWMGNGRGTQAKLCSTGVAGYAKLCIEDVKLLDKPVRGCSNLLLIAMKGDDSSFLNIRLDASVFETIQQRSNKIDRVPSMPSLLRSLSPLRKQVFCCFTDCHYYQPGDRIRVFGISRVVDQSKSFAPKVQPKSAMGRYGVAVVSGSHQIVFQQEVEIPASGMFEFTILLPETLPNSKSYPFGVLSLVAGEVVSQQKGDHKDKNETKSMTASAGDRKGGVNQTKEEKTTATATDTTKTTSTTTATTATPTTTTLPSSTTTTTTSTTSTTTTTTGVKGTSHDAGTGVDGSTGRSETTTQGHSKEGNGASNPDRAGPSPSHTRCNFDIHLTSFTLEQPTSSGKLVSLNATSVDGVPMSHYAVGEDIMVSTVLGEAHRPSGIGGATDESEEEKNQTSGEAKDLVVADEDTSNHSVSHKAVKYAITWTSDVWIPVKFLGSGWSFQDSSTMAAIDGTDDTTRKQLGTSENSTDDQRTGGLDGVVGPTASDEDSGTYTCTHTGYTDSAGRHQLVIRTHNQQHMNKSICRRINIYCTVSDSLTSTLQTSVTVYNTQRFIGLRKARPSVSCGDEIVIEHLVCDGSGVICEGDRIEWKVWTVDANDGVVGEMLTFSSVFEPSKVGRDGSIVLADQDPDNQTTDTKKDKRKKKNKNKNKKGKKKKQQQDEDEGDEEEEPDNQQQQDEKEKEKAKDKDKDKDKEDEDALGIKVEYLGSDSQGLDLESLTTGFLRVHGVTSIPGAVFCHVTASVHGENGLKHTSGVEVHVSSKANQISKIVVPKLQPTEVPIEFVADKLMHSPGQIAVLSVRVPCLPATCMLVVESTQAGLRVCEIVQLTKHTHEFKLLLEDSDVPNVNATVIVNGISPRIDGHGVPQQRMFPRCVRGRASISLNVSLKRRQLSVSLDPSSELFQPGQEASLEVAVRDFRGRPVPNAQVTVFVVPEHDLIPNGSGIYTHDSTEGFVSQFFPHVNSYFEVQSSSDRLLMGNEEAFVLEEEKGMYVPVELTEEDINPDADIQAYKENPKDKFLKKMRNAFVLTDENGGKNRRSGSKDGHSEKKRYGGATTSTTMTTTSRGSSPLGSPSHGAVYDVTLPANYDLHYLNNTTNNVHLIERMRLMSLRRCRPPVALYQSCLNTDEQGLVSVRFQAPHTTSKYKARAIVTFGASYFGMGSRVFSIRAVVSLTVNCPTVLQCGDSLILSVLVDNHSNQPVSPLVLLSSTKVTLDGPSGYRVHIQPNDRAVVNFSISAETSGVASYDVAAFLPSGDSAAVPNHVLSNDDENTKYLEVDSVRGSIHVRAPLSTYKQYIAGKVSMSGGDGTGTNTSTGAGAGTGEGTESQTGRDHRSENLFDHVVVPVPLSAEYYTSHGGLALRLSSLPSSQLCQALMHICESHIESTEHITSQLICLASLSSLLPKLSIPRFASRKQYEEFVSERICILEARQNETGAVGMWTPFQNNCPFVAIHVAHAMTKLYDTGIYANPEFIHKLKRFLIVVKSHIPFWYDKETRQVVLAYALFVRSHRLFGLNESEQAVSLLNGDEGIDRKPLMTCMLLIPSLLRGGKYTLVTKILKRLQFVVKETQDCAHFVERLYGENAWHLWTREVFHTDLRVNAIILHALTMVYESGISVFDREWTVLMASKVERYLLQSMKNGVWDNPQDAAWCILSLRKHFQTLYNEDQITDSSSVGRIWLGKTLFSKLDSKCRDSNGEPVPSVSTNIPMEFLLKVQEKRKHPNTPLPCIIGGEGHHPLHYQVSLVSSRGHRSDSPLSVLAQTEAVSNGFSVERCYSSLGGYGEDGFSFDLQGGYKIRHGSSVRVHIKLTVHSRRYHVSLIDSYPGGFSVSDIVMKSSPPSSNTSRPSSPSSSQDQDGTWFSHRLVSDSHVSVFAHTLWAGTYTFEYDVKAISAGSFLCPPTRVFETYCPSTRGSSCADRVNIYTPSPL